MKILLIGSGGREHALARGLIADPGVSELHVAPGNPGISELAQCHSLSINDNAAIVELALSLGVDLVVIGPELPLVNGVCDALRAQGIPVFGPSKFAAQLEGSKDFAKGVMRAAGVPTAQSFTCTNREEVEEALDTFGAPYVVKHDGLAAGKGVVVTTDRAAAIEHALLAPRVVIEEFLDGPELSLFGISDGEQIVAMQPAQDYKRVSDGDLGPNTGGMGAYSPLPWISDDLIDEVTRLVLQPTINHMKSIGQPFVGLLYAGLAMTSRGIKVIEFNARFGDPETQVLIPRLKTNLATLLFAAATGSLAEIGELEWSDECAVTVVLASEGYPSKPVTGDPIAGIESTPRAYVYHAGTEVKSEFLYSSGGRVLAVTGMGRDFASARSAAYESISRIQLRGSHYRSDIALRAERQESGR